MSSSPITSLFGVPVGTSTHLLWIESISSHKSCAYVYTARKKWTQCIKILTPINSSLNYSWKDLVDLNTPYTQTPYISVYPPKSFSTLHGGHLQCHFDSASASFQLLYLACTVLLDPWPLCIFSLSFGLFLFSILQPHWTVPF